MISQDDSDNVAISYYIEEIENQNSNDNYIEKMMSELENYENENDFLMPQMINYNINFTTKELLLICEYYGFAKNLKSNKFSKAQIIRFLVDFESNPANSDIVFKRQNMWFYINELKNDKFMKKFILW